MIRVESGFRETTHERSQYRQSSCSDPASRSAPSSFQQRAGDGPPDRGPDGSQTRPNPGAEAAAATPAPAGEHRQPDRLHGVIPVRFICFFEMSALCSIAMGEIGDTAPIKVLKVGCSGRIGCIQGIDDAKTKQGRDCESFRRHHWLAWNQSSQSDQSKDCRDECEWLALPSNHPLFDAKCCGATPVGPYLGLYSLPMDVRGQDSCCCLLGKDKPTPTAV